MERLARATNTSTNQLGITSIIKKHPFVNENEMVSTYLTSINAVNETTAIKYNERLKKFGTVRINLLRQFKCRRYCCSDQEKYHRRL